MAGTESSKKPSFSLRLLVDKKKDKVVLAEAGKDFVDVLYSFLALPMGTIVRLLQKFQQDQESKVTSIGCFNNLYSSVRDMGNNDFLTEPCKQILLYPRYIKESQCRGLKLNIDDTEVLKYYICQNLLGSQSSCPKAYSNFCSLRCSCGGLMTKEFNKEAEGDRGEIFVSEKTSFTILENMKVGFASIANTMKALRGLGYTDLDKLEEMLVDVDHKEVLALLDCLFSSETPLNVFLKKHSSCGMKRSHNMPSLVVQDRGEAESNEVVSLTVFVRKQDRKVLYAESGEDFVNLFFSFLVLPLEFVWGRRGSNIKLGCIDNFCKSMTSLSSSGGTNASTYTCKLPSQYGFQKSLLDVCYEKNLSRFTMKRTLEELKLMYPNNDGRSTIESSNGFMKRGTMYIISDDLTITATHSSSAICIMKRWI